MKTREDGVESKIPMRVLPVALLVIDAVLDIALTLPCAKSLSIERLAEGLGGSSMGGWCVRGAGGIDTDSASGSLIFLMSSVMAACFSTCCCRASSSTLLLSSS